MSTVTISTRDIIEQIKLSDQIPEVIEAIARRKIINDAASQAGITVELAELQMAGDNLRLAKKLVTADETWAWFEKHHLSLEQFEELVHTQLLSQKLANHLFAKQVETYFFEHQLDYIVAATYEVVLDDRDLAQELFYAVTEGEITFPEIAREYIQDPEFRRLGGYLGLRRRIDLRPEIAAAVFAANPPQILKPIVTPRGVHLIWVEEIIHPKLDELLRHKIVTELFTAWLKQQIEQADIVPQFEHTNYASKEFQQV